MVDHQPVTVQGGSGRGGRGRRVANHPTSLSFWASSGSPSHPGTDVRGEGEVTHPTSPSLRRRVAGTHAGNRGGCGAEGEEVKGEGHGGSRERGRIDKEPRGSRKARRVITQRLLPPERGAGLKEDKGLWLGPPILVKGEGKEIVRRRVGLEGATGVRLPSGVCAGVGERGGIRISHAIACRRMRVAAQSMSRVRLERQ